MTTDIPILTEKGREAVKTAPSGLTTRGRSILIQVDGKRTLDEIRTILRGLDGLEDAIATLLRDGFVTVERSCRDVVRELVQNQLGAKGATILRKIDEMHAKYGESCWDHLDELDKAARLFYGEVVAGSLKNDIADIIEKHKK